MVLMRSNLSEEVPKDAVMLDELDAINYAWEFVGEWKSLSDTWALRFGPAILGGINGLSGIIINSHFRNKLKLGSYGYLSSVIPISLMPGILTPLFHRYLISTNMLLMKDEACPICYEMRSTAIQLGLGIVYPMIIAPTTAMMLTNRYATARIPDLMEGPKKMFRFLTKLTKPFSGTLALLAGVQVFSSAVITYFEFKNNLTLKRKVMELESKLEAEQLNR